MFDLNVNDPALEEAIAKVYSDLKKFKSDDDEFQKAITQLSKLYAIQDQLAQLQLQAQKDYAAHQLAQDQSAWNEEQDSRPFYMRVDPNTVVTVLGNLAIGLAVIKYEQTGVISTKVMSFMRKI